MKNRFQKKSDNNAFFRLIRALMADPFFVLVAFLGYCLWVCLRKKAQRIAPSLTPPDA